MVLVAFMLGYLAGRVGTVGSILFVTALVAFVWPELTNVYHQLKKGDSIDASTGYNQFH